MLFSLRSFVRSVPVSCWLTIMNQCALDLRSFQPLPLYCCRTRVEIHRSSCVCVDVSPLVLMESMHMSTFYFPVLKTPVLIIYSVTFYLDKTLKQTWSFSHFIGAFVSPQTPLDGTKKKKRNMKEQWGNIYVLLCIFFREPFQHSEFSHCGIDTT